MLKVEQTQTGTAHLPVIAGRVKPQDAPAELFVSGLPPPPLTPRSLPPAPRVPIPTVDGVANTTMYDMSRYIAAMYHSLKRNPLSPEAMADPKGGKSIVYMPAAMRNIVQVTGNAMPLTSLNPLNYTNDHGELFVQHSFLAPGGRFNEQYGWDTYFTVRGLLLDGHLQEAKGMVENQLFEVEHYGKVLNGNRTYYLDRSSPPFLAHSVLAVYNAMPKKSAAQVKAAHRWLEKALPLLTKDHDSWFDKIHDTGNGMSRYASDIDAPCPEVEPGHYDELMQHQREQIMKPQAGRIWPHLKWGLPHIGRPPGTDAQPGTMSRWIQGWFRTEGGKKVLLPTQISAMAPNYKDDRAERESGWDMTDRWNYHAMGYNQVDLNSLLYQYRRDIGKINEILGHREAADHWNQQADEMRARIQSTMYEEPGKPGGGLYYDWNHETGERSKYVSMATFMPLATGIATQEQAQQVRDNALRALETDWGLNTSDHVSGKQWDKPYGWAPLHLIAVEGLRRYGFDEDADRIEAKFIRLVATVFEKQGSIVEKYNTEKGNADVDVSYGNQEGFAWTNAVVRLFMEDLRRRQGGQPPVLGHDLAT